MESFRLFQRILAHHLLLQLLLINDMTLSQRIFHLIEAYYQIFRVKLKLHRIYLLTAWIFQSHFLLFSTHLERLEPLSFVSEDANGLHIFSFPGVKPQHLRRIVA